MQDFKIDLIKLKMKEIIMDDKIYFQPGDIVTLKKDIPNKPVMIVVKKVTTVFKNEQESSLKGIKCRWFTTNGELQEAIWNTKDLLKVE